MRIEFSRIAVAAASTGGAFESTVEHLCVVMYNLLDLFPALQLSQVVELAVRRVNMLKLQSQLQTQRIQYRDVDGMLLFRLDCKPLVTREMKLTLEGQERSVSGGGLSGWNVEISLTSVVSVSLDVFCSSFVQGYIR